MSGSLFRRKANSIARQKLIVIWLESRNWRAARRPPSARPTLKHHLQTQNDFVEFVITKLGMRRAEIRPGVHVIGH